MSKSKNPRREKKSKFSEQNVRMFPNSSIPFPCKVKGTAEFKPRSIQQHKYLQMLCNEEIHYVFGLGPAGSGKTWLATRYAIEQLLAGKCNKIILTRPAVTVDEDHGFLPGSIIEKMAPWLRPLVDVFEEVFTKQDVKRMFEVGVIEVSPLAYMRGRTLKDAIIIADEIQNTTQEQFKMLLTRLGEGSKMILTGDITQRDIINRNGLLDFLERYESHPGIGIVHFGQKDVVRHPMISVILKMYGDE
jgi:phosphate starvation-inducible PhoH-like protein